MSKMRILVVDDIFTNRLLLSEILEDIGCDFFLARNGREAVDELAQNHFDVVLMDIEMPVMNGVEATRYVRDQMPERKRHIPIIALTAHNPSMFFDNYSDAGFSNLLTKPYSVAKIKQLLEGYRQEIA